MANFIVSYDLNGPRPSHQEMDKHIAEFGYRYGRLLETVWYIDYPGKTAGLRDLIASILGSEDLLLVVEAKDAAWTKLLVDSDSLVTAWQQAA